MGMSTRDVVQGGESATEEAVTASLADDWICDLVARRQEARERKDYAVADALREQLVSGGVWVNDRSRFWFARDGRYGKLDQDEGHGDCQAPTQEVEEKHDGKEGEVGPMVAFYHDATRVWPEWVRKAAETVDVVMGNLPWGNKIGGKEDGHRIVERMCVTFSNAVLCLFVSAACFTELCTSTSSTTASDKAATWEWRLKDCDIALPAIEGEAHADKLRAWKLLWHADVSFATLMVLLPVDRSG